MPRDMRKWYPIVKVLFSRKKLFLHSMLYKEYKPSKILSPYIECYWTFQCPPGFIAQKELVVPGGRAELMFSMGSTVYFQSSAGKQFALTANMYVMGQRNTFFSTYFLANNYTLGVRFRPGCFYTFSNSPALYLLNEITEAANVLKPVNTENWYNQVMEESNVEKKITITEDYLLQILYGDKIKNAGFMALVPAIRKDCQTISIQHFCSEHNLYYKKLERQFLQHAGYTPKEFVKISRFYTALKQLYKNKHSLTDIGHGCGYYDQSHFIKDFKSFTSLSPSDFKKVQYQMPRLISSSEYV